MTTISKSLSLLSKKLTTLSIKKTATNTAASVTTSTCNNVKCLLHNQRAVGTIMSPTTTFSNYSLHCRQFSSSEDDKNKGGNNSSSNDAISTSSSGSVNDPDAAWKKFQSTIMYDPSNAMDINELSKKSKKRGGKILRKKKEKQEEMMKRQEDRMFDVGTGQFPPLRYSDEETQRLLKEAYAALPPKGISKKTRAKKRQKNRFKLIRRARRIKKMEKIAHHYKVMEERSARVKAVKAVIDGAEEVRVKDREYQMTVLRKWAMMNGMVGQGEEENEGKVVVDDDVGGEKNDNLVEGGGMK